MGWSQVSHESQRREGHVQSSAVAWCPLASLMSSAREALEGRSGDRDRIPLARGLISRADFCEVSPRGFCEGVS